MKGKKSIRFWGSNVLEGIGITAGAAAILLLFFGMGGMRGTGDVTDLLLAAAGLYPWYLLIVGVFISLILSVGYFQTYYSVLLSMNVTRKAIVCGIFLCMAATMAGIHDAGKRDFGSQVSQNAGGMGTHGAGSSYAAPGITKPASLTS